ncbi:putative lipoprotein [Exiguobacterium sp. S17]|nr:putative lipoprotein [Exiguobacterium sp. S17]
MRTIGITTLLMATIILTGCTEQESALDLKVRPILFDGYHYEPDQQSMQLDETEQIAVHTICDDTSAVSISDRPFVYDATYRSFSRFSSNFTTMSVFHDDEATYAYCQTDVSQYVKLIDADLLPAARREAEPEPLRPRSVGVSDAMRQTTETKLEDDPFFELIPFDSPFVTLHSPLFASLALEVKTQDSSTTSFHPFDPNMKTMTLSLYLVKMDGVVQPLLIQSSENNMAYGSLDSVPDGGIPTLSTVYPLPDELKFGETYPLWELSYDVGGETVKQTISLSYEPPVMMTQSEVDAATTEEVEEATIGYFHKTSLSGKTELHHLDAIQTTTADGETLKQMLQRAERVNRNGEAPAYPLFTLAEGVKSQTFDVTLHERSKKTDVYVTTKGNHYKLSSEDSATWLSLAPY